MHRKCTLLWNLFIACRWSMSMAWDDAAVQFAFKKTAAKWPASLEIPGSNLSSAKDSQGSFWQTFSALDLCFYTMRKSLAIGLVKMGCNVPRWELLCYFAAIHCCFVFIIRCRINRILESPRGYALLIGVGGSGKQSLSRLAAYIGSLEVFQITLKKGYGIQDLRVNATFIK